MTLYDIAADILAVKELIEDATTNQDGGIKVLDDALKADLWEMLEETQGNFKAKAGNICKLIANLNSEAEAVESEKERLAARQKRAERTIEGLKWLLKGSMDALGMAKFESELFTLAIHKNPPALTVFNSEAIPAAFWVTVPETKELNKKAIVDALKSGEQIPGADLVTGSHIRIK